jgi:alanine dehydrogenase
MSLVLKEAEVRDLLTMEIALKSVEEAFLRMADGSAISHNRQRLHLPGKSYLHYMAAGDGHGGTMGLKIYTSAKDGLRFVVTLFDAESGELLALIEANYLGQMRTGAASGLATRFMAREDARRVAIIGTGAQAATQLEAVCAVRKIEKIRVWGRDEERRARFVGEMTKRLKLEVTPVAEARQAVAGADIVVTATSASEPVLEGRWLEPGMHINATGANFPDKRELDDEAVLRAGLIAADSREQSKEEAGDLIHALGDGGAGWERVKDLAGIVSRKIPGRNGTDQITLFKSNGIAIEDVTTAADVYQLARSRGSGLWLPLWDEREPKR